LRADPNVVDRGAARRAADDAGARRSTTLQPPFNNPKIRQALQAAISQEEVLASLGLPPDMYLKQCESIYMCDAPGSTDAGTEVYKSVGMEHARALLKEAGYNNEPVALLHAATSALLNNPGLVYADLMKKAGFNVDIRTSDFATVAQKRMIKGPVSEGGWSAMAIVWNGIDLLNPLSDPGVTNNCAEVYPGWYCDPRRPTSCAAIRRRPATTSAKRSPRSFRPAFHRNVNMVLGGQFSAPAALRANLHGLIPFCVSGVLEHRAAVTPLEAHFIGLQFGIFHFGSSNVPVFQAKLSRDDLQSCTV
jgi:peptide/nickel transport system substrate-binding protein